MTVTLIEPDAALLAQKTAELEQIERHIASCEREISALRVKIAQFFNRYSQRLGHLLSELADLEARAAAQWRDSLPDDLFQALEADFLRDMANEARRHNRKLEQQRTTARRAPPEDLKRLYRMACRRVHPDRGLSEDDRQRRHQAMSAINQAYRAGDSERIRQILDAFVADTGPVPEKTRASRLMQLLCRIAEAAIRLQGVRRELQDVKKSDMNRMRRTVEAQEKAGEDPLGDMAQDLRERIDEIKASLRATHAA